MAPEIPVILNRKTRGKSRFAWLLEWAINHPPEQYDIVGLNHKKIKERIEASFRAQGARIKIYETEHAGDETRLAAELAQKKVPLIVAGGGDGTIQGVVNGIQQFPGPTLGILPLGTSNTLAISLKIPLKLDRAVAAILKGKSKRIDLGRVGMRYFVMGVGMGAEANAMSYVRRRFKYILGNMNYCFAVVASSFCNFPEITVKTLEGETATGYYAIITNTHFYGNYLNFAPEAKIDDGKLDALVFYKRPVINLFRYIVVARWRDITKVDGITFLQSSSLSVSSAAPLRIHLDAELDGQTPFEAQAVPRALPVIIS